MIGFSFSFSSNKSFLFKNNITDVLMNQRLFRIDPNNLNASSIRFYNRIKKFYKGDPLHRNASKVCVFKETCV